MSAWGVILQPGKSGVPFVPPPDGGRLHVSQATLVGGDDSTDITIFYRAGGADDEDGAGGRPTAAKTAPRLALTRLRGGGRAEGAALDLIFDHYAEFSAVGTGGGAAAEVHLTGYELPDADVSDEEEDEDEDELEEEGVPLGSLEGGSEEELSSEGEEDYSDSEDDDEEEDDDLPPATPRPDVVIEELDGDGDGKEAGQGGGDGDGSSGTSSGPDDEEDSLSEGDDDDDSDSGSSDGLDSEEEEEEEEEEAGDDAPVAAAPAWGKKVPGGGGSAPAPAPATATDTKKRAAAPTTPAAAPPAKKAAPAPEKEAPAPSSAVRRYDNGFVVETLARPPPGAKAAQAGKRVEVRYVGRLAKTGKVFDATKGKATFKFRLGVGEVIKGWDAGVAGMKVGEKRRLTIPPQMGYGAQGARPAIPPNATLDFHVELVGVQ